MKRSECDSSCTLMGTLFKSDPDRGIICKGAKVQLCMDHSEDYDIILFVRDPKGITHKRARSYDPFIETCKKLSESSLNKLIIGLLCESYQDLWIHCEHISTPLRSTAQLAKELVTFSPLSETRRDEFNRLLSMKPLESSATEVEQEARRLFELIIRQPHSPLSIKSLMAVSSNAGITRAAIQFLVNKGRITETRVSDYPALRLSDDEIKDTKSMILDKVRWSSGTTGVTQKTLKRTFADEKTRAEAVAMIAELVAEGSLKEERGILSIGPVAYDKNVFDIAARKLIMEVKEMDSVRFRREMERRLKLDTRLSGKDTTLFQNRNRGLCDQVKDGERFILRLRSI